MDQRGVLSPCVLVCVRCAEGAAWGAALSESQQKPTFRFGLRSYLGLDDNAECRRHHDHDQPRREADLPQSQPAAPGGRLIDGVFPPLLDLAEVPDPPDREIQVAARPTATIGTAAASRESGCDE